MIRELTSASAIHLAAVLPAVAAMSSFWIFGIGNGGWFSLIHVLSVIVLFNLVAAI